MRDRSNSRLVGSYQRPNGVRRWQTPMSWRGAVQMQRLTTLLSGAVADYKNSKVKLIRQWILYLTPREVP